MEAFNSYIKSLESRIKNLEDNKLPSMPEEKPKENKINRLGYYPYWRNNIDVRDYSHITLCFLDLNENGTINWSNIDNMNVEHHNKGISIGGWTDSTKIKRILNNHKDKVINQLVKDCIFRDIKYINYDIEYPESNFWIKGILNTTKEQIKLSGEDIKLCVAAGCWEGHLSLYRNCNQYLDWLEIMVYDVKPEELIPYTKSSHKLANEMGYQNKDIFIGISYDKLGDNKESLKFKEQYIKTMKLKGTKRWEVSLSFDDDIEMEELEESKEEEPGNKIYVWEDNWNNPYREMLKARQPDIYDNLTQFRGRGKMTIEDGIMMLSGPQPRIYVNLDIQDVEVSVDYMRVGNSGKGWSGATLAVRSHTDGHSREPDKAHTYYFRLKHEGKVDLVKERIHGGGGNGNITLKSKRWNWKGETWYNIKFRCYNLSNNKIKLEGYVNGKLLLDYTDEDEIMFNARGNVFIRNTDVDAVKYKNFKISQI